MERISCFEHMFETEFAKTSHGVRFTAFVDGDQVNAEANDISLAVIDFPRMVQEELRMRNWPEHEIQDAMGEVHQIMDYHIEATRPTRALKGKYLHQLLDP